MLSAQFWTAIIKLCEASIMKNCLSSGWLSAVLSFGSLPFGWHLTFLAIGPCFVYFAEFFSAYFESEYLVLLAWPFTSQVNI